MVTEVMLCHPSDIKSEAVGGDENIECIAVRLGHPPLRVVRHPGDHRHLGATSHQVLGQPRCVGCVTRFFRPIVEADDQQPPALQVRRLCLVRGLGRHTAPFPQSTAGTVLTINHRSYQKPRCRT